MSNTLLDDASAGSDAQSESKAGSWIVWLLHPKRAIPLVVILLLLSVPLIYRAYRLSRVPTRDEPFDVKTVLEFVVPDADNAFVEYKAAHVLYVEYKGNPSDPQKSSEEFEKAQADGWEHATEPVRKWLDANRPFMELWKKGTAKSDAQYYQAGEYRIDTLLPVSQDARQFARLVRLESSRLLAEGKPDEAWEWLQICFRMSRHVGRHGCLIECLVGGATDLVTARNIVEWANDPRVTASQLRRAMTELREEQMHVGLVSDNLKIEYLSLLSLMDSPMALDLAMRPEGPPSLQHAFLFVQGEPELSQQVIRHGFANWLSQADKPRSQRTKQSSRLGMFEPDPTIPKPQPTPSDLEKYLFESILAKQLLPACSQAITAADRMAARDRVLLTVLALELFAREHGHYPEKLEELVPNFLPEVPEDTHAPPKNPLRYRRDGDQALIYSVGDNGIDDGGQLEQDEAIGYRIGKPRENSK